MPRNLGPLPQGDRQDTLQQLSIKAFRNALPEDKFLFRDERTDDKGVDGALEVKVDGAFTNCRAQVQLKSTDANPAQPGTFNQDGSYSLSIETSNLNYLLNGQSPIYVLWLAVPNEIRFAWAHDEWRALDASNPDWQAKGSFTIRFSKPLTPSALAEIHERILDESQLRRRIHESLARSAPAENVVVSINAKTLASTDPTEIYERLSQNGMTIVSSGYGKQALEWYALLNPDAAKEPRLKLVAAFAASSIGKYHEAKAYLASAVLATDKLSDDEQQFLEYLGHATDYHMGRVDRITYLALESDLAHRLTGLKADEHRLEVLRHERLAERDLNRRANLLNEMRAVVAQIESAPDAHPAQKVQGRLILLSAEGDDLNTQLLEDATRVALREDMGFSANSMAAITAKDTAGRWADWDRRAAKLRDEALEAGHPLLIADAMTARINLYVSSLLLNRMLAISKGADHKPAQPIVDGLIEGAKQAIEVYRLAGSLSGEFQVKLRLADLHHACGNDEAAKALAREILPAARAMNYEQSTNCALKLLEDRTELQQFTAAVSAKQPDDQDAFVLGRTDDEIKAIARMAWQSLDIPASRLPLVEKDVLAGRVIAQERRDWCRHLELLQDLRHTQRSDTAYHIDPARVCICQKLGHESKIPHPDYVAIITGFKRAYCEGCTHREPKGTAG